MAPVRGSREGVRCGSRSGYRARVPCAPARRLLVATALALGLGGVAACGSSGGSGGAAADDAGCRRDWAAELQTLGENGNPSPPGTVLADRYDAEVASAEELARHATAADCPDRLERQEARFGSLLTLGAAVDQNDMARRLAFAEQELRHAVRTRSYDPLPAELAHLFAGLRRHAPGASYDVAPAVAAASQVDLSDASAVKAAVADLDRAADQSADVATCRALLERIGRYELDEE